KEISEVIDSLSDNNNISYSAFAERAIRYYIDNEGRDYKGLYDVIDTMFQHIEEKIDVIDKGLNKNTSAINDVKKDTNVSVQCWNNTLLNKGNEDIVLTKDVLSNG